MICTITLVEDTLRGGAMCELRTMVPFPPPRAGPKSDPCQSPLLGRARPPPAVLPTFSEDRRDRVPVVLPGPLLLPPPPANTSTVSMVVRFSNASPAGRIRPADVIGMLAELSGGDSPLSSPAGRLFMFKYWFVDAPSGAFFIADAVTGFIAAAEGGGGIGCCICDAGYSPPTRMLLVGEPAK